MAVDLKKCVVLENGNVVTPKGRMMFAAIAERFLGEEAKKKDPNDKGEFAVTLVFPGDCDVGALRAAAEKVVKEKWGSAIPGNLKNPIRKCADVFDAKGNKRYPAEMDNWVQVRANTYTARPGVVDPANRGIAQSPTESNEDFVARLAAEAYTGRWARIEVAAKAFDNAGNRGAKFYLNNIQLLDHDEKIGGGRGRAEDAFSAVEGTAAFADTGGSAFGDAGAGKSADSVFG